MYITKWIWNYFFGDNTKIRFSEEGFKQTMETAKEIINTVEDILEIV